MVPADIGTMNTWLAVIAIASLVQAIVVVGLLVSAFLFFRRTEAAIERIREEQIAPVTSRATVVMDKVESLIDRIRSIDEGVSASWTKATAGAGLVAAVVKRRFWPVLGLVRAVRAGLAGSPGRRPRPSKLDEDADSRFMYEGGSNHARSSNLR